jgi:hypothetical protein
MPGLMGTLALSCSAAGLAIGVLSKPTRLIRRDRSFNQDGFVLR